MSGRTPNISMAGKNNFSLVLVTLVNRAEKTMAQDM
jgi:hypothetical protein